jgi:hypothetical protein
VKKFTILFMGISVGLSASIAFAQGLTTPDPILYNNDFFFTSNFSGVDIYFNPSSSTLPSFFCDNNFPNDAISFTQFCYTSFARSASVTLPIQAGRYEVLTDPNRFCDGATDFDTCANTDGVVDRGEMTVSDAGAPPPSNPPNVNPDIIPALPSPLTDQPSSIGASAYFSGQAYPGSVVTAVRELTSGASEGSSSVTSIVDANGGFRLLMQYFPQANYFFAIQAIDSDGRRSTVLPFSQFVYGGSLFKVQNILFPPTVSLDSVQATSQPITISGFAAPGASLEIDVDDKKFGTSTSLSSGRFTFTIRPMKLANGNHFVKINQTTKSGATSDFSAPSAFFVSSITVVAGDFNNDGVVDIKDFSVFLSQWGSKDAVRRMRDDLSRDGKVDIADFSLLLRSFSRK